MTQKKAKQSEVCIVCGVSISGTYSSKIYCSSRCYQRKYKAVKKKKKSKLIPRKCLKCGQMFPSEGVHIRICSKCRKRKRGW